MGKQTTVDAEPNPAPVEASTDNNGQGGDPATATAALFPDDGKQDGDPQVRSREFGEDENGKLTAQRVYRVRCADRITDTPDVARVACPPRRAQWSPEYPALMVARADVRELEDGPAGGGTIYEVTLDYSTGDDEAERQTEDPTDRPLQVRLSFTSTEEDVYQADEVPTAVDADGGDVSIQWAHGKVYCNSARQQFPDGVKDTFYDAVITVSKSVKTDQFPRVAFPLIPGVRIRMSGDKAAANGGKVVVGDTPCCCNDPCQGCSPGNNPNGYQVKGYTVTLAGWQYPQCWGPFTKGNLSYYPAYNHEGGDLNGTWDLPLSLATSGNFRCRYISAPIPFTIKQYRWDFDANTCGDATPFGITAVKLIIIIPLGAFGRNIVASSSAGTDSLDPICLSDQVPTFCLGPMSLAGPATQPVPKTTVGSDGFGWATPCATGVWGGTWDAVPYY